MRAGDVIFVKMDFLRKFFAQRHPGIRCPYILVTHNSDLSVPVMRLHMEDPTLPTWDMTHHLDQEPNLAHWYGANAMMTHPKLTAIPLGMANHHYAHGDHGTLIRAARRTLGKQWAERRTKVYMNVNSGTNPERTSIVDRFSRLAEGGRAGWSVKVVTYKVPWEQFLEDVGDSQFVICPPGNGYDTHRAWESGPLDPLFKGMLIVRSYEEVTPQLLESFQARMDGSPGMSAARAFAEHWRRRH